MTKSETAIIRAKVFFNSSKLFKERIICIYKNKINFCYADKQTDIINGIEQNWFTGS